MVNFKGFFPSRTNRFAASSLPKINLYDFYIRCTLFCIQHCKKKRFLHFQSNDDDLHDDIIPTRWIPDYIRVFKSVKLFVILKFVQSANAVNFKYF